MLFFAYNITEQRPIPLYAFFDIMLPDKKIKKTSVFLRYGIDNSLEWT